MSKKKKSSVEAALVDGLRKINKKIEELERPLDALYNLQAEYEALLRNELVSIEEKLRIAESIDKRIEEIFSPAKKEKKPSKPRPPKKEKLDEFEKQLQRGITDVKDLAMMLRVRPSTIIKMAEYLGYEHDSKSIYRRKANANNRKEAGSKGRNK